MEHEVGPNGDQDEQKSELAWMEYSKKFGRSVHPKSSSQRTIIDFKSSLKRDIEKRIEKLKKQNLTEKFIIVIQINIYKIEAYEEVIELIETVEP